MLNETQKMLIPMKVRILSSTPASGFFITQILHAQAAARLPTTSSGVQVSLTNGGFDALGLVSL
jgi:hypothetical protein